MLFFFTQCSARKLQESCGQPDGFDENCFCENDVFSCQEFKQCLSTCNNQTINWAYHEYYLGYSMGGR